MKNAPGGAVNDGKSGWIALGAPIVIVAGVGEKLRPPMTSAPPATRRDTQTAMGDTDGPRPSASAMPAASGVSAHPSPTNQSGASTR
jgi:hypothetical protein